MAFPLDLPRWEDCFVSRSKDADGSPPRSIHPPRLEENGPPTIKLRLPSAAGNWKTFGLTKRCAAAAAAAATGFDDAAIFPYFHFFYPFSY